MYGITAYFIASYLKPKRSKAIAILGFIGVMWLSSFAIHFLLIRSDAMILYNFLPIPTLVISYCLAIRVSFKAKLTTVIFLAMSITIVVFFAEILPGLILGIFMGEGVIAAPAAFATTTTLDFIRLVVNLSLIIIAIAVLFKILRKIYPEHVAQKNRITTYISVYLTLFAVVLRVLYYHNPFQFQPYYVYSLVMILPVVFFVYFLYLVKKQQSAEVKANYGEYLVSLQSQYFSDIIEQNLAIAKLKHDFITHSKIISDLADAGEYDELRSYIRDFSETYTLSPLLYCDRSAINAVMTSKAMQAKDAGIELKIFFDSKGAEDIRDFDLCAIVANLLQNAIEANIDSSEARRYIKLSAGRKASHFIITQENTVAAEKRKVKRANPKDRGFGLIIIEDIAEKYAGSTRFENNDGVFNSTVMLKVDDE